MNILSRLQCWKKCWSTLRQSGRDFRTVTQFHVPSKRSTHCITWFSAKWTDLAGSYQVQMIATIHFSETCLSATDNTRIALFIWTAECEVFNIAYLNFRPINPLFYMSIRILQLPHLNVLIHTLQNNPQASKTRIMWVKLSLNPTFNITISNLVYHCKCIIIRILL